MNLQERSKVLLSASITLKLKIYYSNSLVAAGQVILDFSLRKDFEILSVEHRTGCRGIIWNDLISVPVNHCIMYQILD